MSDFLLDMGNRDAHGYRCGWDSPHTPGTETTGRWRKLQEAGGGSVEQAISAGRRQESFTSMVDPSSLHFLVEHIPGLEKVVRCVFLQLQIDFHREFSFLGVVVRSGVCENTV
eukprot:453632-Prymnesium_polylepis.1